MYSKVFRQKSNIVRQVARTALCCWSLLLLSTLPVTADAQNNSTAVEAGLDQMHEENRVALVIGNGDYDTDLGPLDNPARDAADFSKALRETGFEVSLHQNLSRQQMLRALLDFDTVLRTADVGLFYFAGHAVQVGGRNFMLPVDTKLQLTDQVGPAVADYVDLETVDLQQVLGRLGVSGNRLNVVVLDACRNNPFSRNSRSLERGLAQTFAPNGTFVAYATSPGNIALDGDGRNSPYTSALIQTIRQPGMKIEAVFKEVRRIVTHQTQGQQRPWDNSSIIGEFYFTLPSLSTSSPEVDPAQTEAALNLSADDRMAIQRSLRYMGYSIREINGVFESDTRSAITQWQGQVGDPTHGYITTTSKAHALISSGESARRTQLAARERQPGETPAEPSPDAVTTAAISQPSGRIGSGAFAGESLKEKVFRDCPRCPQMIYVPAGKYLMGSGAGNGYDSERPQHSVSIVNAFAIGRYEITFSEWDACSEADACPARTDHAGWGRDDRPVINVSWHDAQQYVRWLSRHTGHDYRLPSEAQWEYAARAQTTSEYYFGDTLKPVQANVQMALNKTSPVGQYSMNAFGLFDVHGNVAEWVQDAWQPSHIGAPADGSARNADGKERVIRGGSWRVTPRLARSAARLAVDENQRSNQIGFRVVREN